MIRDVPVRLGSLGYGPGGNFTSTSAPVSTPPYLTYNGPVKAGSGGNALDYGFDSNGLSSDPRLAGYLQSLTPDQLQMALNGDYEGALKDLISEINEEQTGTGRGSLPCGGPDNPYCGPAPGSGWPGLNLPNIPSWVWIIGAGILGIAVLQTVRR